MKLNQGVRSTPGISFVVTAGVAYALTLVVLALTVMKAFLPYYNITLAADLTTNDDYYLTKMVEFTDKEKDYE